MCTAPCRAVPCCAVLCCATAQCAVLWSAQAREPPWCVELQKQHPERQETRQRKQQSRAQPRRPMLSGSSSSSQNQLAAAMAAAAVAAITGRGTWEPPAPSPLNGDGASGEVEGTAADTIRSAAQPVTGHLSSSKPRTMLAGHLSSSKPRTMLAAMGAAAKPAAAQRTAVAHWQQQQQ